MDQRLVPIGPRLALSLLSISNITKSIFQKKKKMNQMHRNGSHIDFGIKNAPVLVLQGDHYVFFSKHSVRCTGEPFIPKGLEGDHLQPPPLIDLEFEDMTGS